MAYGFGESREWTTKIYSLTRAAWIRNNNACESKKHSQGRRLVTRKSTIERELASVLEERSFSTSIIEIVLLDTIHAACANKISCKKELNQRKNNPDYVDPT